MTILDGPLILYHTSSNPLSRSSLMWWKRLSVDAPSRDVPSLSVFLPKKSSKDVNTSRCDVTWRHDIVPWRQVTSQRYSTWHHIIWPREPAQINLSENHAFQPSNLDLWPTTLTFELIRDIVKVNPSTKSGVCTFNGSAGKALTDEHTDTQKHRHTDRRDRFHTLDRWRGREWSWVATWASNQFNMQVDLGKYCILNQLGQKLDRKVETLSTALSQQSRFFNCRHIPTALSTEIISKIMILSQDLLTDIQSILPYAWIS